MSIVVLASSGAGHTDVIALCNVRIYVHSEKLRDLWLPECCQSLIYVYTANEKYCTNIYCKRRNFCMGVIFMYFDILPSLRKIDIKIKPI